MNTMTEPASDFARRLREAMREAEEELHVAPPFVLRALQAHRDILECHVRTWHFDQVWMCRKCGNRGAPCADVRAIAAVYLPEEKPTGASTQSAVASLNEPMMRRLRACAADTRPDGNGRIIVYPSEAQQLVAAVDEALELRQLFDLQQRRMAAATARWQAADPAAREGILPDLGRLLKWLMDEADKSAGLAVADFDLEAFVEALHPLDVCRALEEAGWRPSGGQDGKFRRYHWPVVDTEARTLVPLDPFASGYRDLMRELLWSLQHTARFGDHARKALGNIVAKASKAGVR